MSKLFVSKTNNNWTPPDNCACIYLLCSDALIILLLYFLAGIAGGVGVGVIVFISLIALILLVTLI